MIPAPHDRCRALQKKGTVLDCGEAAKLGNLGASRSVARDGVCQEFVRSEGHFRSAARFPGSVADAADNIAPLALVFGLLLAGPKGIMSPSISGNTPAE